MSKTCVVKTDMEHTCGAELTRPPVTVKFLLNGMEQSQKVPMCDLHIREANGSPDTPISVSYLPLSESEEPL